MNIWLGLAGAVSVVTLFIHVFAGGKEIVRPLLAANDLDRIPKLTLYYCWHLVTIAIAAIAAGFLYSGFFAGSREIVIAATGGALLFAALSLLIVAHRRVKPLDLPQWILFAPAGVLGLLGCLT